MSKPRSKKKQRRRGSSPKPARVAAPPAPDARPASRAPDPRADRIARFEVRDGVARPKPVWAPFPLTEIGIAAGLAIFVWGFASNGSRGLWLLSIGALVLAVVVGEMCLREHFAGFRSHTLLLAALAVTIVHGCVFLAVGEAWRGPLALVVDLTIGGALAWLLHDRFRTAHERARSTGG